MHIGTYKFIISLVKYKKPCHSIDCKKKKKLTAQSVHFHWPQHYMIGSKDVHNSVTVTVPCCNHSTMIGSKDIDNSVPWLAKLALYIQACNAVVFRNEQQ